MEDTQVKYTTNSQPICHKCKKSNKLKKTISCTKCDRYFHRSCVGLTKRQAEESNIWTCIECFQTGPTCALPTISNEVVDFDCYLKQIQHAYKPIIRIPKAARSSFARGFCTLIRDVVHNDTSLSWQRLMVYPMLTLRNSGTEQRMNVSLTATIKKRVDEFIASSGLPEVPPAQWIAREGSKQTPTQKQEDALRRAVDAKLSEFNVRGAVQLLSSTSSIVSPDQESFAVMQRKHPVAPYDLDLPSPPPRRELTFAAKDICEALKSFANGSGAGPDGLRPQHLKDATSPSAGDAGCDLLQCLSSLISRIASQGVHPTVKSTFHGARLIALTKANGDLRPIAVGCTIRRLTAKVLLHSCIQGVSTYLKPQQVGVGTRLGCEAAVHAVREFIQQSPKHKVLLKLDLSNAFNSIRRDTVLKAAQQHIPDIYHFVWDCYSVDSTLFFGDHLLTSSNGVQQGDPLGPMLFALAIHEVVKDNNGLDLNVWYLDDGCIAGDPEMVLKHASDLTHKFKELGLIINPSKCELYSLDNTSEVNCKLRFSQVFEGIKIHDKEEWTLLGAPLTYEALKPFVQLKKKNLERLLTNLSHLNTHQGYYILTHFLHVPKLMYALRASPLYQVSHELKMLDEMVKDHLELLCNVSLNETSWKQASLPVRLGGLGIRSCSDLALPCHLASYHGSAQLVRQILESSPITIRDSVEVESVWNELYHDTANDKGCQKDWDTIQCKEILQQLQSTGDQYTRARLQASQCPHSADWSKAIPIQKLGTLVSFDELRIAIALRLGAKICISSLCRCGRRMDELGLHGLSCRFNAGRFPRHAELNTIVKRALAQVNVPSILEPNGLSRNDGKRPDGLTLYPWKQGKCLTWDVTVTDTYCTTNLMESATSPAAAATHAEDQKRLKYSDIISRTSNIIFQPIAFETSGVWGPTTDTFLREISKRLLTETGDKREAAFLAQRISIAILRGNAASILACLNNH